MFGFVGISRNDDASVVVDRFEGVAREIDDETLNFIGVASNFCVDSFVATQIYTSQFRFWAQQFDRFGDDGMQIVGQ